MSKPTKPPLRQGSADDFQTPPEALGPLYKFLPSEWTIWECAQGHGWLVQDLKDRGYQVIGTDIKDGHDFLHWQPEQYNCIVTNPPYSIKNEFLERCYALGKPFALLLPLTTLETKRRQFLFDSYGLQIMFLPKRINFRTPSGKGSGSWFAVAWFTYLLNLPKDLYFTKGD